MDNICIYVLSVRWGGEMAVPSRGETLTVAPVPLETRQERGHILVPLSSGVIGTVRHCSVIPHFAPYGLSIRWLHHLPVKPNALVFLAARVRAVFRGGPSRPQARPSHPAWGRALPSAAPPSAAGSSLRPSDRRPAQRPACVARLIRLFCPRQVLPVHNLLCEGLILSFNNSPHISTLPFLFWPFESLLS